MATDHQERPDAAPPRKPPRSRRPAKRGLVARLAKLLAENFPKTAKLFNVMGDWMQRKPLWVRLPFYGLMILGLALYGLGSLGLKLRVVEETRQGITDFIDDLFAPLPVAKGKGLVIAVALIEGDSDETLGESLGMALRLPEVILLMVPRRLRPAGGKVYRTEAETEAHQTARDWLAKMHADILIWGQTIPKKGTTRLFITLRNVEKPEVAEPTQPYLAFNFLSEVAEPFHAAVQAQVLAFLAQFDPSHVIVDQLDKAVVRLEGFVRSQPNGPGRDALVFALANSRVTLVEQAGDVAVLTEATAAYRELLSTGARLTNPLDWGMTQNNLGNALCSLGKREGSVARLGEAADAYRAALQVYDPDSRSMEWAVTQNNLGLVLQLLGERQGRRETVEDAIKAYGAALTRFHPETEPADWAMTKNNLGNALVAMGKLVDNTDRIKDAIEVFKAALNFRLQKKAPLSWAMTQNNLGNALGILGEREKLTSTLEEAVKAYKAALTEYDEDKMPDDWAMAKNNLGTALARLGEKEEGTSRLKEAVAAFRSALKKRDAKKPSLERAKTLNNLGAALVTLGQRDRNLAYIEEAIRSFDSALDTPGIKSAPAYRTDFQNNRFKALEAKASLAPGQPSK